MLELARDVAADIGRDHEDDVVAAIVVMNRTLHTNDVAARIKAEVDKINSDGTLAMATGMAMWRNDRPSSAGESLRYLPSATMVSSTPEIARIGLVCFTLMRGNLKAYSNPPANEI